MKCPIGWRMFWAILTYAIIFEIELDLKSILEEQPLYLTNFAFGHKNYKIPKKKSENDSWKLELCLDMNIILGYFWIFVSDHTENLENNFFWVFQIFEKL